MHYTSSRGCFPICEDCFNELKNKGEYDKIFKYYTDLIDSWNYIDDDGITKEQAKQNVIKSIKDELGIDCIRDYTINKILK